MGTRVVAKLHEAGRRFPKWKDMRNSLFKLCVISLCMSTCIFMFAGNERPGSGMTLMPVVYEGGTGGSQPPHFNLRDPVESQSFNQEKRLPSALIIGVPFGGTRALQEWMTVNPLFVGPKEPVGFFIDDSLYFRGPDWYREQMPLTWPNQTTIERDSSYFVNATAARRIYDLNPNMKLLLITRDPTKRLVSDYTASLNEYTENESYPTFEEVVFDPGTTQVNERMAAVDRSIYHKHLKIWLRIFPRKQIYIVDGDLFLRDPAVVMKGVEKFLDLPNYLNRTFFEYDANRGYFCRKYKKEKKKVCLQDKRTRKLPKIKNDTLPIIHEFYRKHNKIFFDMIQQWLPYWD